MQDNTRQPSPVKVNASLKFLVSHSREDHQPLVTPNRGTWLEEFAAKVVSLVQTVFRSDLRIQSSSELILSVALKVVSFCELIVGLEELLHSHDALTRFINQELLRDEQPHAVSFTYYATHHRELPCGQIVAEAISKVPCCACHQSR